MKTKKVIRFLKEYWMPVVIVLGILYIFYVFTLVALGGWPALP